MRSSNYPTYKSPYSTKDSYTTKLDQYEKSPNGPHISPYKTDNSFNSINQLNSSTQKPIYSTLSYPSSSTVNPYIRNYPDNSSSYDYSRTKYRSPQDTKISYSAQATPNKDYNIYSTPKDSVKQKETSLNSNFPDQTPPKIYKPPESYANTLYSPSRTNFNYDNPRESDQGINRNIFYNSADKFNFKVEPPSELPSDESRHSVTSQYVYEDTAKASSRGFTSEHHQIIASRLKPASISFEQQKYGIKRFIIPTNIERNQRYENSNLALKLKNASPHQPFSSVYNEPTHVEQLLNKSRSGLTSPSKSQLISSPSANLLTQDNISNSFQNYRKYVPVNNSNPAVSSFEAKVKEDKTQMSSMEKIKNSKTILHQLPNPKERESSPIDLGVDEEINENEDARPDPRDTERTSVEATRYSLTEKINIYSKKSNLSLASKNTIPKTWSKPAFPSGGDNKVLNTEETANYRREKNISLSRARSTSFDRKTGKEKTMSPLREIYESTKNFMNRIIYRTRVKCDCSPEILDDHDTCWRAKNWLFTKYEPSELDYLKKTYNQVMVTDEIDQKCARQVGLDIPRTFPSHKLFARNSEGSAALERVLKTYAKYDPQIGYVQGLNFVAASVLYHAEEYIAFWILVILFERNEIRDIYTRELAGVYKHGIIIDSLIKRRMPILYQKMVILVFKLIDQLDYGVSVQMFCIEWVCGLFGSIIPIETMGLFLDKFIENGWQFFYQFILSLLGEFEETFEKTEDLSEMMLIFKNSINRGSSDGVKLKIEWEKIIENAKNISVNADIIFKLHGNFDIEKKNFIEDPTELLSQL